MRKATIAAALMAAVAGHGVALAQTGAAAAASSPGPIAALQQQLKVAGYAPGPINGIMTDQTRQATIAYERRTGRAPRTPAGAGAGATADPVRQAQAALARIGLFTGPVDGVVGPATRDAIIRFEAKRHLAVDPRVSDTLLAALAEAASAPAASTLSPSASAAPAPPPASAASAPPAPGPASAEATGRRPLPSWVNPPPIH